VQQLTLSAQSPADGTASPDVLFHVDAPVRLLLGARSNSWFADSVAYLAEHLPNSTVREIDAAHFGPYTAPEAVARQLSAFFSSEDG
jgi:pimeloyl-ACP methyl ester carboxylesterase